MVIKSFEIDYRGNKETIEYETELNFGDTEAIINKSIDLSDINKPKINVGNFRKMIVMKALRKAPFAYQNEVALNTVPNKTIQKVLEEISKDYPLVNFLGDWMMSFVGSAEDSESLLEPTPSAPSNSDGPKKKQTNTEQSSSNS